MTDDNWWNHAAPGSGQPPPGAQPYQQQPYEYPALHTQQPAPYPYQPGYGPPPQQQPPRGNAGLIIALVLVVVALIGGGITLVVLAQDSSSTDAAPATSLTVPPSTTRQTTTSKPAPTTAQPTRVPSTTTPVVPGFQGVAVPSRGIAYDVPTGWTVDTESMIRGFEGDKGRISGTGTTVDGKDYCPSANRTITFVGRSDLTDTAAAATNVGKTAATLGYDTSTGVTATTPAPLTAQGGLTGHLVETSGNWRPSDAACTSSRFSVYTFAFAGPQNPMLVLTIAADRGVTDEVNPELAKKIAASVRPIH